MKKSPKFRFFYTPCSAIPRTRPTSSLSLETRRILNELSPTPRKSILESRSKHNHHNPDIAITTQIPTEILFDIFLLLDRNDVEKCQLICHQWNSIIAHFTSHLPLYLFYRLQIGEEDEAQNDENNNSSRKYFELIKPIFIIRNVGSVPVKISEDTITKRIIESLKLCTFVSCGPMKLCLNTYLSIRWLVELCGHKFHTLIFVTFGPVFDRVADCAVLLPKILDECVLARKVSISLNEEETFKLLISPKILQIPLTTTEIVINCDTFDCRETDLLLNFIASCEMLGANRYSIKFCNLGDGPMFCERFVEMFHEKEDPTGLLKHITFTEWPVIQFDTLLDRLHSKNFEAKVVVEEKATAFVYEIKRKDGWNLEILLRKHLKEIELKYTAEFKIEKL